MEKKSERKGEKEAQNVQMGYRYSLLDNKPVTICAVNSYLKIFPVRERKKCSRKYYN